MSARLVTAVVAALLLSIPSVGTADVIRVPGDQPTIQDAIEEAAEGDTVMVTPDTYTGPSNRDLDFGGVNMLLIPEDDRVDTVIDCEGAGRGFHFSTGEDTSLVIQGFTVINAVADSGAGAKCTDGSSPKFVECTFSGNTATDRGGAVMARGSSPILVGCVFEGNTSASLGGAMACAFTADALIRLRTLGATASAGPLGTRCTGTIGSVTCLVATTRCARTRRVWRRTTRGQSRSARTVPGAATATAPSS